MIFKAVCVPGYIAYVLVCIYPVNGAHGFLAGCWQLFVILSVMNLIDRFLIDGYWGVQIAGMIFQTHSRV